MEHSIYIASPLVLRHTLHRSLDIWEEESLVLNVNIIFGWFIITTEIHGYTAACCMMTMMRLQLSVPPKAAGSPETHRLQSPCSHSTTAPSSEYSLELEMKVI